MRYPVINYLRGLAASSLPMAGLIGVCLSPASAQTLPEALAGAYATNPTLRAARAELRAVNEGVPQALANWRPDLSLTGSAGKQRIDSQTRTTSTDENTTPLEATARLIQPLYRGGRTIAATARAEHEVRSQRSTLHSVEQLVLQSAVAAYMDVWRDHAEIEFNKNNERVIARQLEAAQDRFTVGEVTRTDVAQSETRLAVATADRIAAEGALKSSRAVYAEIIGGQAGVLQAPGQAAGLPANLKAVIELSLSQNPNILAASFAERAAQRRVREVFGELLPSVQLNASVSHSEETNSRSGESDRAQILAEVTIPLYQQGAVSSRVREAKQTANQRRIEVEESRRRTEQEAISAWEGLQTARAQIRSFEFGVRSAEIALEGVRQENAVGARTILDILDAEQELLDAQVDLVRAERDETVAEHLVLGAIGRLTARDLELPVDVYDPEQDYKRVRGSWFGLGAPGVVE